ncbi:hypothetical protein HID58_070680 [Brassica napus]|uniref:BnaC06g10500D protein n=4 Tax=Brassica TaxID=3705 RepID=A0A078GLE2_BRANA|nr:hypothetical protein HID58_070680 [Brassica napus]CDY26146.1 BnaC06g10500D [Brassica napus]
MYIALPQIAKQVKWLSSRQLRCNWATKGATFGEDKHSSDGKSVVELTKGAADGNLASEVTQLDLHRMFHTLSAGVIEEVGVQLDKGFGFTGTASNPLPPPVPVSAVPVPGLSPVDLLAYERQLGLAKMHPQAQHSLRHVNVAGASAAMSEGGYQNVAAAHQQLIYYSVINSLWSLHSVMPYFLFYLIIFFYHFRHLVQSLMYVSLI